MIAEEVGKHLRQRRISRESCPPRQPRSSRERLHAHASLSTPSRAHAEELARTTPGWKIPLGGLTLLFLLGGFAAILITVITTSFRSSDVYRQAMTRAAGELPGARRTGGADLQAAWLVSGQLNVSGSTGNANLSIPISGPRGKGTIRAVADKSGGVWRFTYLQVSVEGQPATIDLLSIQPPAERDF